MTSREARAQRREQKRGDAVNEIPAPDTAESGDEQTATRKSPRVRVPTEKAAQKAIDMEATKRKAPDNKGPAKNKSSKVTEVTKESLSGMRCQYMPIGCRDK
jgi:hypothetical protein